MYREQTKRYIKQIADSVQKDLEDYIQANASILKKQNQQKQADEQKLINEQKQSQQNLLDQQKKLHAESQAKLQQMAKERDQQMQTMKSSLQDNFQR